MTNYQLEQFMLEEQFVKRLLIDYNIREVTTRRQAKNGTREFEFPVPCYTKERLKWFEERNKQQSLQLTHSRSWFPNSKLKDLPRLRLACFKSGYVRKQNGQCRAYQINPTFTQNQRYVWMRQGEFTESSELYTQEYTTKARARITSPLVRLNFMLKYYLKNYA
jgi:hypothetical protein